MAEPTLLIGIGASLKSAMEIISAAAKADAKLSQADLKLKLADATSLLADVRTRVAELQDEMRAKDERIASLTNAFEAKDALIRAGDAMYKRRDNGTAAGSPFCLRCWENDHVQRSLVIGLSAAHRVRVCPVCNSEYEARMAADR